MRIRSRLLVSAAFAALITITASSGSEQQSSGSPAVPEYKYSPPLPAGIVSPGTVETRLRTLKFFDGFPDKTTVERLYDNRYFQRAVQAYSFAIPAVRSQAANRKDASGKQKGSTSVRNRVPPADTYKRGN